MKSENSILNFNNENGLFGVSSEGAHCVKQADSAVKRLFDNVALHAICISSVEGKDANSMELER